METVVFQYLRQERNHVLLYGHPTNVTDALYVGQQVTLEWNRGDQRMCVHCGEPATMWKKPFRNLQGQLFRNSFGQTADIGEAVCDDHYGKLNPCTFNTQTAYAPGCSLAHGACERIHSECRTAFVYFASTDMRVKDAIKVGQCLLKSGDTKDDISESSSLLRRVISGGYAHAVLIQPEDNDFWLGSAQLVEREITELTRTPQKFFNGGVTKATAIPYFVGNDDVKSLMARAEESLVRLRARAANLPRWRELLSNLHVGEVVAYPYTELQDCEAIETLDVSKISMPTRNKGPQHVTMEILGIRGKYVIGRDPATGHGVLVNTDSLKGLNVGVQVE